MELLYFAFSAPTFLSVFIIFVQYAQQIAFMHSTTIEKDTNGIEGKILNKRRIK